MTDKPSKAYHPWTALPVVFAVALFCCVLWGSATPAIKIAYRLFKISDEDVASRLLLSGTRFLLAGMMTILFGSFLNKKLLLPKKESLPSIFVLSLLQTVGQYYFFFMALVHITGVRGSVINASGNFFAILIAVYIFHTEKMTLKKLTGCIVGFIGILVILGDGSILGFLTENSETLPAGSLLSGSFSLQGEGAMLAAALFYGFSGCFIKLFSKKENPVVLSGYQFMLGGAILALIGLFMGGTLHFTEPACYLNLLYMGFISAGAYTLWGILLKHNPVSRISIFGFMNPVMGVLLSALILGENKEAFSVKGLLSLLLVVCGIIIVNRVPQTDSEHKA